MLILKFTCDDAHILNTDLILEQFTKALGVTNPKDIAIKKSDNSVKLYLGSKTSKNISLPIEMTDEDLNII